MTDVYGRIGNEDVELSNAATEATLKLLLASSMVANKQTLDQLKKLGIEGGLFDKDAWDNLNNQVAEQLTKLEKTNVALNLFERGISKVAPIFNSLDTALSKLIAGTAKSSDVMMAFSTLPFGIGLVASGLSRVAKYQEDNLASYQKLTNAGINFGGSLTELRQSASDLYLTMDQFTDLMTRNSQEFTLLGGGANAGAAAFKRLGAELINSDVGTRLMNLGFTSEQLSQGLIDYISISGGRTTRELENSSQLINSAASYMEELDRLADITGKTREQQAKDLKETMRKADIEMFRASLSEKDRTSFDAAMARGKALYGKAGEDLVIAAAQGRAVTGEAGKQLSALAPQAARAIGQFYSTIQRTGNKSAEIQNLENQSRVYSSRELKQFAGALGTAGGVYDKIGDAAIRAADDQMTGQDTLAGIREKEIEREKANAKRQTGQAADEIKRQKEIQEARKNFTEAINNLVNASLPLVTTFVNVFTGVIDWFSNTFKDHMDGLVETIVGVVIALGTMKTVIGVLNGYNTVRTALGGASAAGSVAQGVTGAAGAAGTAAKGLGVAATIEEVGLALATLGVLAGEIIAGGFAIGAVIIQVGAAIAGATWLVGATLPTLAEGFGSFAKIEGGKLVDAAKGIGALGLALAAFGVGSPLAAAGNILGSILNGVMSSFGKKDTISVIIDSVSRLKGSIADLTVLGPALQAFGQGYMAFGAAVASIDVAKADRVTELMKKPQVSAEVSKLASQTLSANSNTSTDQKEFRQLVAQLNTNMAALVRYMSATSENTSNTVSAIKKLNGNYLTN